MPLSQTVLRSNGSLRSIVAAALLADFTVHLKRFEGIYRCVMDLLTELFKISERAIRTVFPSMRRAALMPRMLSPFNRPSIYYLVRIPLHRLCRLKSS